MGLDSGYGLGIGSLKPGVCLSTSKPTSPFDGQVIYMTDVDQTAVWDGTQWTVLAPISSGRNVVINGAMQVAQRGTSQASITSSNYFTADRWLYEPNSMGTWTESVENDAPAGSGFRKSLKLLCTTADASPAAGDFILFDQRLEGQNLQQFLKGTASAKQFSLTFWVKSNATGTYNVELLDNDNTRVVTAAYTVDASGTWEKKTITFPADTTGAFDNDNASSLQLSWWLGAGSTFTSGTRGTVWATPVSANRAVGQTNVASATNNYWQVTGVQLEAGAVATPFEFEDTQVTLAKCLRYFNRAIDFSADNGGAAGIHIIMVAQNFASTGGYGALTYPIMRTRPAITFSGQADFIATGASGNNITTTAMQANQIKPNSCEIRYTVASGLTAGQASFVYTTGSTGKIDLSAEL
jgi:hypothetical protein